MGAYPASEGPSIYKEFLKEKGESLHHVKFAVDDYDQAVGAFKEQGMDVLMSGTFQGGTMNEGIHLGAMVGTVDLVQR